MRLWHEDLLSELPRQQLLGQHRECCALRGNGWGRNHSTVNYVFDHSPAKLVAYHFLVIDEMERRGYNPSEEWKNCNYRGKNCEKWEGYLFSEVIRHYRKDSNIYSEHNEDYFQECIDNLQSKGINMKEVS